MTKRMLIDATHAEETRVAVVDENRLVEFDYESKFRKPLKGSIFLAKVTRVEPSLQAAFVNFGGNRHGFLPFSEIHPDYFRIPISDREALLAEQEELLREAEEEDAEAENEEETAEEQDAEDGEILDEEIIEEVGGESSDLEDEEQEEEKAEKPAKKTRGRKKKTEDSKEEQKEQTSEEKTETNAEEQNDDVETDEAEDSENTSDSEESEDEPNGNQRNNNRRRGRRGGRGRYGRGGNNRRAAHRSRQVEILGGTEYDEDSPSDAADRARFALRRKYKIQEVIKRGQIMLIQVSREERGNKGAAVSTYLSMPGRYGVLMPNSPRAGGVSRKIANPKDRARLRDMLKSMDIPKGMSVILRTAGVSRTKTEIKRDIDYLMRLWSDIRELTLNSSAPSLIYEEADLMKRAIRDLYTREVEDILVAGKDGYDTAKKFMKMMIPSHAKRVQEYTDETVPLFHKYGVEGQISEIGEPTARLKSGGYLVINPTEALVSIDVNSGRATKERHIEETALNTNLEAAEEVARQLRLRDLGGLVVVDFIDMEDRRNNGKVERRLKEALSSDRARIQIGRISSFGLLEMSRQRLNPSLTEAQFETCPHCDGVGNIRTPDATTIMLLRAIEDEGIKNRAAELIVHVSNRTAIYLLNNKRQHLDEIEQRYSLKVLIRVDDTMAADKFRIEVSKPAEDYDGSGNDNDNQDEQNKDDRRSSRDNNRRRGRRGGRGRGRGRNQQDDQNADDNDSSESESQTEQPESSDEPKEDKPKRSRRSSKKSETEEVKDATPEEKEENKDEKPKPGRGRKKAEDKKEEASESKTEESSAQAEEEKPKKRGRPSKKKEEAKKLSPSNDTKPAKTETEEPKENPAADYETVNEAPKNKKKGWWNRLVE